MSNNMGESVSRGKKPDRTLEELSEKYRRLQTNMPGMVYLFALHVDGSYSFQYVNSASRELFDLEPEDLMQNWALILTLIHPDDRDRLEESINQSAKTLSPWREELRYIVNGEVRWYDCISRPELQPNGDILWDGIILETTDRRRTEEALRESEERFRATFEQAAVGIAHVGWRGLLAGFIAKIVSHFAASFSTDPKNLVAWVGPTIGPCCFEVGENVADAFRSAYTGEDAVILSKGKPHVNLWRAIGADLRREGIPDHSVQLPTECTACNSRYGSYRRDKEKAVSMGAIIGLLP